MRPEMLRLLYLKNGWPKNFDGDAFEVDMARAHCAERASYSSEEPIRKVKSVEQWSKYNNHDIERHSQELANADDDDTKWTARFKIWQAEQRRIRNQTALKEHKEEANLRCPDAICQREEDLPLWELEWLRMDTQSNHARQDRCGPKDGPLSPDQRRKQRKAAVYTKAYEASAADAKRLCPGRTFEQATVTTSLGRQDTKTPVGQHTDQTDSSKSEMQKVKEWAAQLPENGDLPKTRQLIDVRIKQCEKFERCPGKREKWLAEHGDTD